MDELKILIEQWRKEIKELNCKLKKDITKDENGLDDIETFIDVIKKQTHTLLTLDRIDFFIECIEGEYY